MPDTANFARNINKYLKSEETGLEGFFTGQILCIVALICWYLMVAKEAWSFFLSANCTLQSLLLNMVIYTLDLPLKKCNIFHSFVDSPQGHFHEFPPFPWCLGVPHAGEPCLGVAPRGDCRSTWCYQARYTRESLHAGCEFAGNCEHVDGSGFDEMRWTHDPKPYQN